MPTQESCIIYISFSTAIPEATKAKRFCSAMTRSLLSLLSLNRKPLIHLMTSFSFGILRVIRLSWNAISLSVTMFVWSVEERHHPSHCHGNELFVSTKTYHQFHFEFCISGNVHFISFLYLFYTLIYHIFHTYGYSLL